MTETYPLVAPGMRAFVVPALVALLLVGLLGYFAYSTFRMQRTQFTVSAQGLRVQGEYPLFVPAASLVPEQARAVDLDRESGLQPNLRTFGTGLPGYHAGWFRTRAAGKAYAVVTDRRRVVYVPTSEGYALLLSVPDPERFVARLRELVPVGGSV
ncbi:MAG TPA: PH domain-containing protein [Longimicrobiaceae bacterium]|nr:PH domain-containing protein [Longimicrobiaceae bacterium]